MSILSTARPAKEMTKENWVKAFLVGRSKTGKTESSITLPLVENKPLLALGLTPRTKATLRGYEHVHILEIIENRTETKKKVTGIEHRFIPEAWEKTNDVLTELWTIARSKEPFPYSGIIFDDSSAANRYAMNFILSLKKMKEGKVKETEKGIGGAPKWETHYVPHTMEMTRVIAGLLIPLPCHVVVCGHYDVFKNEDTNETFCEPAVYGKQLRSQMPSWFNEVYECITKYDFRTKKERYYWTTFGTGQKDFLGSTLNKQNKVWESPFEIDLSEPKAGFAKLLELSKRKEKK